MTFDSTATGQDSNPESGDPKSSDAKLPDRYGAMCLTQDQSFMEIFQAGLQSTEMNNHPWLRPRFFHMVQMLKLTSGLNGATVDAGCFRGLSSYLICKYLNLEKTAIGESSYLGREHFMIDSYEGLSEPVSQDGQESKQRWGEKAFTDTSVERVLQTMKDFPDIKIVQGWIPDVLTEVPEQQYRFVHIDVDLYQPTLDCLRYFYPRLVHGGIIVIDDFGPWRNKKWPGCQQAVRLFSKQSSIPFAALDTGNAVFFKR
ncbi:TylF/MycF family methyltransferase [Mariniblastus sp.]|nr:TylF/MycF family methyltransferase [Mariniblastus sp.]MDC0284853.1 TylF/MycF family methyltransferase [Mariniblastus sp.]